MEAGSTADGLENISVKNPNVQGQSAKRVPKQHTVSVKSKIEKSERAEQSDLMKSTQHQWNFAENDKINKEIADDRPNLESLKKSVLPMNNTAMNFNSSLFDQSHRVPDDHFEPTQEEDDIESRDVSNFEDTQRRLRAPVI